MEMFSMGDIQASFANLEKTYITEQVTTILVLFDPAHSQVED